MSDLISRKAAIERIEAEYQAWGDEYDVRQILGDLEDLPSAQPERKNGRWYRIGNTGLATCDCGFVTERYSIYKYCPNCGSYNGGGEDG